MFQYSDLYLPFYAWGITEKSASTGLPRSAHLGNRPDLVAYLCNFPVIVASVAHKLVYLTTIGGDW